MNRQELDNERLADFLRNVQDIEEIKNITRALAERIDQLERQGTGCDYFREKAREEGNFFKIVFEHAPIGMAIISLDGRCLQANPALCEMSGYSEEELMDLHLDKHTYPEDLELESAYREQMLQGKIQCYRMEKRFFHKLGYLVWTDFCVSLVKSKRGEPMFFIAQIQDISGHKRILEALKTSEKRFYRLADKAQDLFFSYRFYPKPGFQYVNRACQDVIGYKPEDFYADPRFFSKIIHPDDRYILKDILRSTLPNSEPIVMRLISKDKQIKWTEQYLVPYYDNANKLIAIEGVIRDITEKIRMQGEMARLESLNLVSEMAAAVGHEVRNPMTVVRGFLQMLADKEEFKEYLDYINLMIEELDRANSIITEFLSLAKKRPVKLEKQNLNSIINDLYALIQANALATQNNVVKRLKTFLVYT
jgi:PAS domain S-box-containing protein